MNTVELLQFSLANAFNVLGQVTAGLTQEQADWQPPGIANPIGGTYWHALTSVDHIVHKWCVGEQTISERDGWADRALTVSAPEPEHGGDYLDYLRAIRIDIPAVNDYASVLSDAVQGWLGSLAPEDLAREVETPVGALSLAQLLETFVIWHVNAHCGEIAALKGCLGAKGYPW
jgi:hypothetical protein